MVYPNRRQWWVLYVAVPLVLAVWIDGGRSSTDLGEADRAAISLAIGTAFLVWRLSQRPE